MIDKVAALAASGGRAVLFTVVEGDGVGGKLLVVEGGETTGDGPAELAGHADEIQRGGRNPFLWVSLGIFAIAIAVFVGLKVSLDTRANELNDRVEELTR